MPHRLYRAVAERARHRCEYCLAPEKVFNFEFEVDHVQARTRGGADALGNLALACRSCNSRKGDAAHARDPTTKRLAKLFDPRGQAWDRHFRLDLRSFFIEGRTAQGRATAARLGMNLPKAVDARALWVAHALFGTPD